MKRFLTWELLVSLTFFGIWPGIPIQAVETEFRPMTGGQVPETQENIEAGLEETQIDALAGRWYPGSNGRERARQAMTTQARVMRRHRNEVLHPLVSRSRTWLTPEQIDAYWEIQAPLFGIAGGGGTVGVQVPVAASMEKTREGERFAIVAVDDSGGDAGKRRHWTVIAPGDIRNGLVNQLSDPLKDLTSARLSTDYGLPADPPKRVKEITPERPFSFREAFRQLMDPQGVYYSDVMADPTGLWVVTNLDALMAVLDRVVLNQPKALAEFPELEKRVAQYQEEGRVGSPAAYADYPILKAALGNLMVHAAFLVTGATIEPASAASGKRELDPERIKQAEWLLERALGLERGHTVLASTVVTDRYGVFSRELPHSLPNDEGEVLIGRIRPWNEAYDPDVSKDDRKKRQAFTVQERDGEISFVYLDDNLQVTESPRWSLPGVGGIPLGDLEKIRAAAQTGEKMVLQGTALPLSRISLVELVGDQMVINGLDGKPWPHGFPDLAVSERIRPRLEELRDQGLSPRITMIVGEDEYSEADTWHGTDLLRHDTLDSEAVGSWILYHGHVGEAPANPEAIVLIDNIPPGGLYVIGPGSDGTSLRAVHSKKGMWEALTRAVARGVKVVLVLGIAYDTDTHGLTYLQQLRDWELEVRIATGNPEARLNQAITHVAINQLPPLDSWRVADQLDSLARSLPDTRASALAEAAHRVRTGSQIQAIQALSRVTRMMSDQELPLLAEESIQLRVWLLSKRLGGMAESAKYRGPREPFSDGELDRIQQELGVEVIYKPLVVVNTELRADRGVTQQETNARSDRTALRAAYEPLITAEAGLEDLPAPDSEGVSMGDLIRTLSDRVRLLSDDSIDPAVQEAGLPFVVAGTQEDTQGRPGLAYGMVLAQIGFQVGFIAETVEEEEILQGFSAKSGLVAPWQIVRIDPALEIYTYDDAIRTLRLQAHERGIEVGEPVELGVRVPIVEPLVTWLADLGVRLPAQAVRTANWLISQAAGTFA